MSAECKGKFYNILVISSNFKNPYGNISLRVYKGYISEFFVTFLPPRELNDAALTTAEQHEVLAPFPTYKNPMFYYYFPEHRGQMALGMSEITHKARILHVQA